MSFKLVKALIATNAIALTMMAAPASAAIQVTFGGFLSPLSELEGEFDFQYSYYYNQSDIRYTCVEDYLVYCDTERVPLVAASGFFGDTQIPHHTIMGVSPCHT